MIEVIERIPIKDSTINSAMAYENYGDYYALFIGKYKDYSIYRSLMQFELPALVGQGVVRKVELLLYIIRNDEVSCEKEFRIYRTTESFNESTVSFANKPDVDKEPYINFTIKDEINTYVKVDITRLFIDWYCGKYPNYGLLIEAIDENISALVGFYSKDAETPYIPKLQINFERSIELDQKSYTNIEKEKLNFKENYVLGDNFFENGAYEKAYECYKKIFEECSIYSQKTPKLFLRMIVALDKIEEYDEALEMIAQGLKHFPDFTDLAFLRGNIYFNQGKFSLAIKEFNRCMDMEEAPVNMSFIVGVEGYRSLHALAQIYCELEDYDEAYNYCLKALHLNPKYTVPLHTMAHILCRKQRDLHDIKIKFTDLLGTNLDGKDYMILGDIFFKLGEYSSAYEYFSKAEEFVNNHQNVTFAKGMCQLYLKQYVKSYECFVKIKEGELYEEAVYKMILCEFLSSHMNNAAQLLNILRNPENNNRRMIYYALRDILEEKTVLTISDDKEESEKFFEIIFELLDILIKAATPEVFEKSLNLLNLIEHNEVLLRLAKLYYKHGLYRMAFQEFLRSIKNFEKIDSEGLSMMKKALEKTKSSLKKYVLL